MALKVNLATSAIGVPIDGAYARITGVRLDKEVADIQVTFHASPNARVANAQAVQVRHYTAPMADLKAFMPALYEWLKTQPAFTEAEDA